MKETAIGVVVMGYTLPDLERKPKLANQLAEPLMPHWSVSEIVGVQADRKS